MKDFIKELYSGVEIDLEEIAGVREEIVSKGVPLGKQQNLRSNWETGTGAVSMLDCIFLTMLVKKLKPKKIFEIGTWFGTSAGILSSALDNDVKIYTCDTTNVYTNLDKYKNSIVFCNTHSSNVVGFLKENDFKVDFVFADGVLSTSDADWLLDSMGEDFIVSVHDYKLPSDKGIDNIELLKKRSKIPVVTFCPEKDIPGKGYDIGKGYNINSSVGLIMSEKVYKNCIKGDSTL